MTEVVAALIWDGNRFLTCQRPAHKARGLLWEFVGGKVEPGETPADALVRECAEELEITIAVGPAFMEVTHTYPDLTVHLTLFNAYITQGVPKLLEHNALRWISTAEIDELPFCPADTEILEKLRGIQNAREACLIGLADREYRDFHCRLMPTVSADRVLGVRMPVLRSFVEQLPYYCDLQEFLHALPHHYYEEDNLHGLMICQLAEYDQTVQALNTFLPYVNNWATCDLLSPKAFSSHPAALLPQVLTWLLAPEVYTRRFAIGVLMKYYLDSNFEPNQLDYVVNVPREEYYVRMMVAWYYATALAKQYSAAVKILEDRRLDPWTHNKTIQKATESYRISKPIKAYLRTLKI